MNFRTRNYKHEIRFDDSPRSVLNYTDEIWETLCRNIAEHDFNGLVFYPYYHPFEFLLDYKGYEQAASQPAARRTAFRKALNRGLAIAHHHGLKTFMQHYVCHFTEKLAETYHIRAQGRLANVEHPEIDRYMRYCYREIFHQMPDLDGLYFNFESSPSAWEHVLNTAIVEFNRMPKKPIAVYRLWEFTSVEGMRKLLSTYKGRSIIGHKIPDTNDVYYLPVADSRVGEWKRQLGKVEWMFLVGPCHNCGTNICDQLWGDYDFVQSILADAKAKGADSISFHTVNDFFSPGLKVFSKHEQEMARFNWLHLQATVDFVRGIRKTRPQRAAVLAEHVGCPPKAGLALLDTIEASSKLVPLVYTQFCYGSSAEAYLNRGHISHVFDPYFYFPATELSHQALKPHWNLPRSDFAWLVKQKDSIVAPDGYVQYIIDYVDPGKPKAKMHPARVAAALKQKVDRSLSALRRYRRLAGPALADQLEPYVRANSLAGEYVRHEILGAIKAYSGYFARSRSTLQSGLRQGLAELKKSQAISGDDGPTYKALKRVYMLNRGPDHSHEIKALTKVLRHLGRSFPFEALADFLTSRRLYNDIRRWLRPARIFDLKAIRQASKQMAASQAAATKSLRRLQRAGRKDLVANVQIWLDFLASQQAETSPPTARCPSSPNGDFQPLVHDHCFRRSESFADDFLAFFQPVPARPESSLRFRAWHTKDKLMVSLREDGVNVQERKAKWEDMAVDSGSLSCVTRFFIDAEHRGKSCDTYIVWPKGELVGLNLKPQVNVATKFSSDANGWQVTAAIPFKLIGRHPAAGDVWGFNVTANPSVSKHKAFTWAPQYDAVNPKLFGKLKFVP